MKTQTASTIPYGRQNISKTDIEAVVQALSSDWITQGPAIDRFENTVASYCSANHAIAVSSATAALHLACLALGLGRGDWLWTSPNTFVASANCGLYCDSNVDFVDIDPKTYNMSVDCLAAKLSAAEKSGRLPKVVVPVHFAGQSCEMEAIKKLSDRYGFYIVEDASHAIGGSYQNQRIGNCAFSDITIFSFHPVKIVTTAEGGMILTNQPALHEKLTRLRTHGITRNPSAMVSPPSGPWDYQQIELGYNYRMTDIQAALGYSQMQRLDSFVQKRRQLADIYNRDLKTLPLILPYQHPDTSSAFHLYVIELLEPESRLSLFEKLQESGIGVNVHYIPVHLQPYYHQFGFRPGNFPNAEQHYARTITLPLYFDLTATDQNRVVETLGTLLTTTRAK